MTGSRRRRWMPSTQLKDRPKWQAEGTQCTLCQDAFTLWTRKHHCRNCGHLVCSACSKHRMVLEHLGYTRSTRVCQHCFSNGRKCSSVTTEEDEEMEENQARMKKSSSAEPSLGSCSKHHGPLPPHYRTILRILSQYAEGDWRFVEREAVKMLMSSQCARTCADALAILKQFEETGHLHRMRSSKCYELCRCQHRTHLFLENLIPKRRDAVMQACVNCMRFFPRNTSTLHLFCSLDCRTTLSFRQYDHRQAEAHCHR